MKKTLCILLLGLAFSVQLYDSIHVKEKQIRPRSVEYIEGDVLIRFSRKILQAEFESVSAEYNLRLLHSFSVISAQREKSYALFTSDRSSTREMLLRLNQDIRVETVSPNYLRRIAALPDDREWEKLWGLEMISAPAAWDITIGSELVIVGVIDTGVDYLHPDLSENIWKNPGETPSNGVDDDGNGYIDDVYGWDFSMNDNDPMDADSHGTHVAGIISAVANNQLGVCGLAWSGKIMPLKAGDGDTIADSDSIKAIEYAIKMKRDYGVNLVALNASWGESQPNLILQDAIEEAEKVDIALVAAAGNGGEDGVGDDVDDSPFYPACFPSSNIVAVAASNRQDQLAGFSNFGIGSVDLAAPGDAIFSTVVRGLGLDTSCQVDDRNLEAATLEQGGKTGLKGISGQVVDCKKGVQRSDFPPSVQGNIALVERGEVYFRDKVTYAQEAGASAVVIYNNEEGLFNGTLVDAGDWIPAISISRQDGLWIKSLNKPFMKLVNSPGDYDYISGTSMAAPYVSGCISLLASLYPEDNVRQRIGRLIGGCDPVPGLEDKVGCGGRLNVQHALQTILPVSLSAVRKVGNGWLVSREAGWILFSVDSTLAGKVPDCRFLLERRGEGGSFSTILSLSFLELMNGTYEYWDMYLDKYQTYSYRVRVVNGAGEGIGSSNIQTI